MNLNLIALDNKASPWVDDVFQDYARKIHSRFKLHGINLPATKRNKNLGIEQIQLQESERLLAASSTCERIILLDGNGKHFDSLTFAKNIQRLTESYQHSAFLVGGPNGHHANCQKRADECWSLSTLTLPHPLVRVVFAEQCFRAWSLITGHPYHK